MNTRIVTAVLSLASVLIVSSCMATFSSCKRGNNSEVNVNADQAAVATTPPFATKEPARYRAVRTITSIESGSDKPRITTTSIARDGLKRREEFDSANGEKIVYLTIPTGAFILVPSSRVLATLDNAMPAEVQPQAPDADLLADRLLNESAIETRYQKLGSETLNGRSTTKYRVLITSQTKGTTPVSETLIWVDEALEMPIRWETKTTSDAGERQTRMELTEISLDATPIAFELPKDYRKVEMPELLSIIRGQKLLEMPKTVKN